MKKRNYFGLLLILGLLIALAPIGIVTAAAQKEAICHLDEYGVYHLIHVSASSLPAHMGHGDAAPEMVVPEQPGYVFSDACAFELNVSGHWTGHSGLAGNMIYTFEMDLIQLSDRTVTGTIVYTNYPATRTVTGEMLGSVLTITTEDASYWATVSGTASGVFYDGYGIDSGGYAVQLEAWREN